MEKTFVTKSNLDKVCFYLIIRGKEFSHVPGKGVTFQADDEFVEAMKNNLVSNFGCSLKPVINEVNTEVMGQKENHSLQKETPSTAVQIAEVQGHLQSLSEIFGKTPYRLSGKYRRCQIGIQELSGIIGVLQTEEVVLPGDSSTSSVDVEIEIAKCISRCLSDFDGQTKDIAHILSLVKTYGVVRPLPERKCSVSLQQIHLILQDNFEGSWLCKLLNIFLGCYPNVEAKTILF